MSQTARVPAVLRAWFPIYAWPPETLACAEARRPHVLKGLNLDEPIWKRFEDANFSGYAVWFRFVRRLPLAKKSWTPSATNSLLWHKATFPISLSENQFFFRVRDNP